MRKKSKLPGILANIADVIGEDGALALAAASGGTRIHIPARVRSDHWLARTVGIGAARKLSRYFAVGGGRNAQGRGASVEIPMAKHRRIADVASTEGLSARQAALRVGVTARTIHRHRAQQREARR